MYELKHNKLLEKKDEPQLNSEIIEVLFENRRYIKKVFSNLHGIHGITHMAMTCIDPLGDLIVFSTTPNIECNLINQKLWSSDSCFIPNFEKKNLLLWWNYQDERLKRIKLTNNYFTFGMSICRPIDNFTFIYSFATNEKKNYLTQYYETKLFDLIDMGDYFYKSLRELYITYKLSNVNAPNLSHFTSKASSLNIRPFLRLVPPY